MTADDWDAHWATRPPIEQDDRAWGLDRVADHRARGIARIWLPGCGISRAPRVHAELGFDVLATDWSPRAIAEQHRIATLPMHPTTAARLAPHRAGTTPRTYTARVHDLRDPLDDAPFDLVWDRHVMHRYAEAELAAIARAYAAATRAGGTIVVDLLGVQQHGPYADAIERAFVDAGCFVPGFATATAFRADLAASGIAARTVLGNVFAVDPAEQPRVDELLARCAPDPSERASGQVLAVLVYSTG